MSILEVKGLSFAYSDEEVFENISFRMERGDFIGIIGSNGTGKSTLIKLILGLLPVKSGEIYLLGKERKSFKDYSKIGYVSQKAASFNSDFPTTVRETVSAGLYSKRKAMRRMGITGARLGEEVDRALEKVGMSEYSERLIGRLSGGQQQRVFIARALVSEPELIFLDEPTVGVDAPSVDAITEIITGLNKSGISIVMTNHDIPSLISVSNKLLVLSDGGAELYEKDKLSEQKLKNLGRKDGHHR
ncbi:MAG: metal ABC transporter ATP-binding protein [Oscillospiraceae bacterium]|nr:metal ABC transporter ATP-binding protein [Oscillospiraceae bacterium]